jgi:hypothetical protein
MKTASTPYPKSLGIAELKDQKIKRLEARRTEKKEVIAGRMGENIQAKKANADPAERRLDLPYGSRLDHRLLPILNTQPNQRTCFANGYGNGPLWRPANSTTQETLGQN